MTKMSKIDARALLQDATAFLWAEADLLDACDYDAWLDLWTDDGLYIMPMGEGTDYANQLNLCYDNARMRRDRIARFQAGFSISSAPPARTVRTISRIVVQDAAGDVITLRGAEHVIENKFGRQRSWAANVEWTLKTDGDDFRLHRKVAKLLNSDGMLNSFSYLF